MKEHIDDILNIDLLEHIAKAGYTFFGNEKSKWITAKNEALGDSLRIRTKPLPMVYQNNSESLSQDRGNIINFTINRLNTTSVSPTPYPSKEQFKEALFLLRKSINQLELNVAAKKTTSPVSFSKRTIDPYSDNAVNLKTKELKPLTFSVLDFLESKRYIDPKTPKNKLFRNCIASSPVKMNNGKIIYNTAFVKKPFDNTSDITNFSFPLSKEIPAVGFTAVYNSSRENKTIKRIYSKENIPWISNISKDTTALLIGESPLDCLAHYELFSPKNASYLAFEGGLSPLKKEYVFNVFDKINENANGKAKFVSITDNDRAGYEYDLSFSIYFNSKKNDNLIEEMQYDNKTKFIIHNTKIDVDNLKKEISDVLEKEVSSKVYNNYINVAKTKSAIFIEVPRFKNKKYYKFLEPLTKFFFKLNNVEFLSHKAKKDDWNDVLKSQKIMAKVEKKKGMNTKLK